MARQPKRKNMKRKRNTRAVRMGVEKKARKRLKIRRKRRTATRLVVRVERRRRKRILKIKRIQKS